MSAKLPIAHFFERDGRRYKLEAKFINCCDSQSISFDLLVGREESFNGEKVLKWRQYDGQDAKVYGAGIQEWFVSARSMEEYIHKNFYEETLAYRKKIAQYVLDRMPQYCIDD